MGRSPCCEGMNKGAWTAIEDQILRDYIMVHGEGKWGSIQKRAGLKRCGKSCRLRWLNYLSPNIIRGNITPEEDDLIIRLHNLLGNRWSLIAGRLPGRTDNEIKNHWNTYLSKRVEGLKPTARNSSKLTEKKTTKVTPSMSHNKTSDVGSSTSSGILVTPQVHQLPEHYQYSEVANNVHTLSIPKVLPPSDQSSKDRPDLVASKEEDQPTCFDGFVADFSVGDLSIISGLLEVNFTNQTGHEFLPLDLQYWSCTSTNPTTDNNIEAEFGFWASLLGPPAHQEMGAIIRWI